MRRYVVDDLVAQHIPEKSYPEQWDIPGLKEKVNNLFGLDLPVDEWAAEDGIAEAELHERLIKTTDEAAAKKAAQFGPQVMRQLERAVLLQTLDGLWREHILTLEHLRQVIGLRGYGQRDPLNEYKAEAFELFESMIQRMREAVTGQLMRVEIIPGPPPEEQGDLPYMEAHHVDALTGEDELAYADAPLAPAMAGGNGTAPAAERNPADPTTWGKVGRNEVCPCGSGKKYKHCHGRFA
jgi:preprotein translocase subunit SecA